MDRAESQVVAGHFIFLKKQARVDSLTPKSDGPYQILVRREANVKLRLPPRDKWIHLDNCKNIPETCHRLYCNNLMR